MFLFYVRTILKKINKTIDNTPDWKSNDTYVYQKNCSPVYDWDGKYYMSQVDAEKNWDEKPIEFKITTSGMPDKSVSSSECKDYADKNNYGWSPGYTNNVNPSGCFIQGSTVYFGVYADGSECGNEHNSNCIEKKNSGIKEEIKTHSDKGRVVLSIEEKKKYPASSMRKTTNGKFLTNDMHPDCQRPGLDSSKAWCGQKSTDDFIQMITVSGGLEMIKGVVTQGRKDHGQWVETFEVYVSRNGDSWQQVKDASGNLTFTGNTDKSTKVTNYFQNRVEAKYIRFVTKTWNHGGHNSMRIGYIKDLTNTVDCNEGDGMLQGEPWYRITFNKQKTILRNGMSLSLIHI